MTARQLTEEELAARKAQELARKLVSKAIEARLEAQHERFESDQIRQSVVDLLRHRAS